MLIFCLSLISALKNLSISLILLSLNYGAFPFWRLICVVPSYLYSIFKNIQSYFIILFKMLRINLLIQAFTIEHKVNKYNVKIFILYSEDICHAFFANTCFNFFWNVLSTKIIKVCHTISIYIQCYPVSSHWLVINKVYLVGTT